MGDKPFTCGKAFDRIYEHLNKGASVRDCPDFNTALKKCLECVTRYEFEKLLVDRLQASHAEESPESLKSKVRQIISSVDKP